MTLFLRTRRTHGLCTRVPQHRLLHDALPGTEQGTLSHELGSQGALDSRERVEILDLGFCAEERRTSRTRADVRVDAKASLLHVDVAHLEQLLERAEKRSRCSRGANVRLTDDLDQRHASAVEIDGTDADKAVVDRLPSVLLDMNASNSDRRRWLVHDAAGR